jgi:hypothetical protein
MILRTQDFHDASVRGFRGRDRDHRRAIRRDLNIPAINALARQYLSVSDQEVAPWLS